MGRSDALSRILVRRQMGEGPSRGTLVAGSLTAPCALGRGGITHRKREGDGGTPSGRLSLVACYYRADRVPRPTTGLPIRSITPIDGWCDDPADRRYNRPVALPYPGGHEIMWRDDALYDIVVALDWNLISPVPGRGSAIFFHLASPDLAPTAGCVAVDRRTMAIVLAHAGSGTFFDIA